MLLFSQQPKLVSERWKSIQISPMFMTSGRHCESLMQKFFISTHKRITLTTFNCCEKLFLNFSTVREILFVFCLSKSIILLSFYSDDDTYGQFFHSKHFPQLNYFVHLGANSELGKKKQKTIVHLFVVLRSHF
jgi:hypothetical protein